MSIESPLIGSGSQEEVDLRVNALIDLGKSHGFLTYEELNEYGQVIRELSDRIVSAQKPIRILYSLKWDSDIEEYFFKNK